jgi:mannose-6-phosphate isomerase-like protein (cupin superfamily)
MGQHAQRVVRWDASARRFAPDKMQKVSLFQTPGFFLDLYCLEPGQAQKPHAHAASEKVYLVVEGSGSFNAGDGELRLGPGEAICVAAGETHGVRNDTDSRLVVLTLMVPPPS